MKIKFEIDCTVENLDKLKVFCESVEKAAKPEVTTTADIPEEDKKKLKALCDKGESSELPGQQNLFAKEPDTAKSITKTDVRAAALALSKAGKQDALKSIFGQFTSASGATAVKLSDIQEKDYAALMKGLVEANG